MRKNESLKQEIMRMYDNVIKELSLWDRSQLYNQDMQ